MDVRNPGTTIGCWIPDLDFVSSGMTFEAVSEVFQSRLKNDILPLIVEQISKEDCVLSYLFPQQELDSLAHHQSRDSAGVKGGFPRVFSIPSRFVP